MVAAWIPLQETPLEMGPLAFCENRHCFKVRRDLEISDERETTLKQVLGQFRQDEGPFAIWRCAFLTTMATSPTGGGENVLPGLHAFSHLNAYASRKRCRRNLCHSRENVASRRPD